KRQGRIVKSYRETGDDKNDPLRKMKRERPAWVESALERSIRSLRQSFVERRKAPGLPEEEIGFMLLSAEQDDLGLTHVRLNQLHNGVEVFGEQLIAHLDAESVRGVSGRVFAEARIETTPVIESAQAIEAAKAALGYAGELADSPEAKLVVLPHRIFK